MAPTFAFPLQPNQKRADTLQIKAKIANLLTLEKGEQYWEAFGSFLTGKTTRDEFETSTEALLIGEVGDLHNTLILAILFNTTAVANPPSSSRHSGWFPKRKREDNAFDDARDPKRRRLKLAVMALSRNERSRLKGLASLRARDSLAKPFDHHMRQQNNWSNSFHRPPEMLLAKANSAAFQKDYARCQQAQLCAESGNLPDPDTLKDRMSFVAYNMGIAGGTDNSASSVIMSALELHLKNILAATVEIKAGQRSRISAKSKATREDVSTKVAATARDSVFLHDISEVLTIQPTVFGKPLVGALARLLTVPCAEDISGRMTEHEKEMAAKTGRDAEHAAEVPQQPDEAKTEDRIATIPDARQVQASQRQLESRIHSQIDKKKNWSDLVNPVALFKNLLS